jgi:hypothetical protein
MTRRRGSRIVGAVMVAAMAASCGLPCRSVSTRALELECEPLSPFRGEIHFDSAATFETFLLQDCLAEEGAEAQAAALIGQVDFTTEAVFVASGAASLDQGARCILERSVGDAEVCDDGLKVSFDDIETDGVAGCPSSKWTVAFALPRDELRAALAAGDQAELR